MNESPLVVFVVGTVMLLLVGVTVFDAYEQHGKREYDAPKWVVALFSGTVSATIWWRFKRKKDKND